MSSAEKWLFICPAQPHLQECMIFMETAEKKLFTYQKAKDLSISAKYTFQGTNAFLVLPEGILLGASLTGPSLLHLLASFLLMLSVPNMIIFLQGFLNSLWSLWRVFSFFLRGFFLVFV